jgi:1,4-dihydroxy-2-naphthoate octaprenyltransferase
MLLCVEFPDRRGDEQVGKNTLVVRLGVDAARALHHVSLSLAYLLLPVLVLAGLPGRVGWAIACTAPLALWQLWLMRGSGADDASRWEPIAFASVALVFASTLCELLAFASI